MKFAYIFNFILTFRNLYPRPKHFPQRKNYSTLHASSISRRFISPSTPKYAIKMSLCRGSISFSTPST